MSVGRNIEWSKLDPGTAQLLRSQGYTPDQSEPRQRAAETAAATRARRREPAKPNKYHAQPTTYNGVRYDSRAEAAHAMDLDMMVSGGPVAWWLRQVNIPLGPDFRTRVDFLVCMRWSYIHDLPQIQAHEFKGVETREFARVRKLWPKYAPFSLHIIKRGNVEVIEGKP